MAIVQTVDIHSFRDAFKHANRESNFSYEGLEILFDHLENLSEETGEDFNLDVIALCCEYEEASWYDVAENYNIDLSDCEDDSEIQDTIYEYLTENTSVCGYDDEIVVFQSF